jgi:hypothetical protein
MTLDGRVPLNHCFAIGQVLFAWSAADESFLRIRPRHPEAYNDALRLLASRGTVLESFAREAVRELAAKNGWDNLQQVDDAIEDLGAVFS